MSLGCTTKPCLWSPIAAQPATYQETNPGLQPASQGLIRGFLAVRSQRLAPINRAPTRGGEFVTLFLRSEFCERVCRIAIDGAIRHKLNTHRNVGEARTLGDSPVT